MHLQYVPAEGCGAFFAWVESNIISVGPVHLLTSMAITRCVCVPIWQPRVSKWYWRNGQRAESHRPKHEETFHSETDILKGDILAVALLLVF